MDLNKINVELRPRSGWQSIDLGFQMARQWFLPLASLWLCLAIPCYLLLKLLPLPGYVTLIVWWWFKPLYEAPLSFWCSRAMFSEQVSHKQALAATRQKFTKLLSSYLSIRRLSTSRSQDMNVVMLENLTGKPRTQRVAILNRMATRTFALVTTCFHFEAILFYGILLTVLALLPSSIPFDHSMEVLFGDEPSALSTIITEITTLTVGALIAPFYVCAGFSLYINRRTQLEAWDIELEFRRASSRVRAGQHALSQTIITVFMFTFLSAGLMSAQTAEATTAEESKAIISSILDEPDFGTTSKAKRLRLKEFNRQDKKQQANDKKWFDNARQWLQGLAKSIEIILWALFSAALLFIAYTVYRNSPALQQYITRLGWQQKNHTNSKVFDLDIRPETLPSDIPATARSMLQQGKKREAMGLLYRGALSRLVHQHGMTIQPSATESHCVTQVNREQPEHRSNNFKHLTSLWQRTAYAPVPPEDQDLNDICDHWKNAFDGQAHV